MARFLRAVQDLLQATVCHFKGSDRFLGTHRSTPNPDPPQLLTSKVARPRLVSKPGQAAALFDTFGEEKARIPSDPKLAQ